MPKPEGREQRWACRQNRGAIAPRHPSASTLRQSRTNERPTRVSAFGLRVSGLAPFALLFALLVLAPVATLAAPPNIVVILADDQGWGDLSVNGNTNLSTPNIDSLAQDGALFDRFYVCPVCSPTRAEFLTGRYHPRGGVRGVSTGGERLNLDEKTIADTFKAAGYATGAFGKWHNGSAVSLSPQRPRLRRVLRLHLRPLGRATSTRRWSTTASWCSGKGFITDDLTDHALAFIERATGSGRSSATCRSTRRTRRCRCPTGSGDKFADADLKLRARDPAAGGCRRSRARALAMCENIDWNVGRMLDGSTN